MIEIKVTGPAGTIDYEMLVIKHALEEVGIPVLVEDFHPFNDRNPELTEDEFMARCNKIKQHQEVKLIAVHCPWGG